MKLTPDAKGTCAARRYLLEVLREASGGNTFDAYISNELAGDFAWNLVNHLLAASASAEPVAEVIKWRMFTGHTAWDFKVFDKTLEHGAKLYAAPRPIEAPDNSQAVYQHWDGESWTDISLKAYQNIGCNTRVLYNHAAPRYENASQAVALSAEQEPVAWVSEEQLNLLRLGTFVTAFAARDFKANVPLFDRAALSAPTSMSGEPSGDFEKDLWSLVDEARQWEAAYRDSSMLYGSLDPYKGAVEVSIRHIVNRYAASAAPSAENRPAQDDVRDAQRYRWLRNQRAATWHGLGEMEMNRADEFIDAAIASQSAKEPQ